MTHRKPAQKSTKKKAKPKGTTSARRRLAKPVGKSRVAKAAQPLLLKLDALDRKLLQLTKGPYSKIIKGLEAGKKKLDEEKRLALMVSERILKKAREVRRSLKRTVRL